MPPVRDPSQRDVRMDSATPPQDAPDERPRPVEGAPTTHPIDLHMSGPIAREGHDQGVRWAEEWIGRGEATTPRRDAPRVKSDDGRASGTVGIRALWHKDPTGRFRPSQPVGAGASGRPGLPHRGLW